MALPDERGEGLEIVSEGEEPFAVGDLQSAPLNNEVTTGGAEGLHEVSWQFYLFILDILLKVNLFLIVLIVVGSCCAILFLLFYCFNTTFIDFFVGLNY